jgi:oxygen-independent coproporphyrinogen-3 oxidase
MPGDAQSELFLLTHLALADLGYQGYEVSNFAASPWHRSAHNLKYWCHAPYLGMGPSAHSFDGRRRWWNLHKVRIWQREVDAGRLPEAAGETLTDADLALEAVMLGLRTTEGVDLDRMRARFGVELAAVNAVAIERMVAAGHVELDGAMLRPTVTGLAIADTLARTLEVSTDPQRAG